MPQFCARSSVSTDTSACGPAAETHPAFRPASRSADKFACPPDAPSAEPKHLLARAMAWSLLQEWRTYSGDSTTESPHAPAPETELLRKIFPRSDTPPDTSPGTPPLQMRIPLACGPPDPSQFAARQEAGHARPPPGKQGLRR